ncbi:MAG: hypothetical protein GY930_08865 [bacterium]|nr:hypothetical protein [bacterium]
MKTPPPTPDAPSPRVTPEPAGHSALEREDQAEGSEDLLRRCVPGDPLGVRSQVSRRLRERCLLLDPHGVSVQVLASIAGDRRNFGLVKPGIEEIAQGTSAQSLVESAVEEVIDDCVAGRLELPVAGFSRGGVLTQLCGVLKLSRMELDRACVRFNALPAEARRAFHALILQRRSLESACRRSASAAESWSKGATSGLAAILGAPDHGHGVALSGEVLSIGAGGLFGGEAV